VQKRKTLRPLGLLRSSLPAASPRNWLSADHQVDALHDLVDELDPSAIAIPAQSRE
jgi:hypothetical protein